MYRYRCAPCRVTSPEVRTLGEVYAHRDRHRAEAHGGLIPDGERLSYRQPDSHPADWRIPAAAVLCAGLWLLDWLIRHI